LAFSFVEGENKESWLWFLRHLKIGVVQDRPNVCLIHDRHAGLLSAIKSMQENVDEPAPWLDLQSRWCMRHMAANFYTKFRSKKTEGYVQTIVLSKPGGQVQCTMEGIR